MAPFALPASPARAAGMETFAQDAFGRTVSGEWQRADFGGVYSHAGDGSDFAVGNGTGKMVVRAPRSSASSTLSGVAAGDVKAAITVATNRSATGKGQYVSLVLRNSSPGTEYRARVRFAADGTVLTSIQRVRAGVTTLLAPEVAVPQLFHQQDRYVRIRASATGVSPTTIRVKAWRDGASRPRVGHPLPLTPRLSKPRARSAFAYLCPSRQ